MRFMQSVILLVITTLGRYTAILLAIPAIAVAVVWFTLMEEHIVAFLLLAPAVIPLFTGSIALLLGLLFSGLRRPEGRYIDREQAPTLWAMWDELSPVRRAERRLLKIDGNFNASIQQRYRILGLFGREVVMTVGVPLLSVLDTPRLKSVIAHEIGHAEKKHIVGSARLAEFERSFGTVFEFMPVETSISGGLLYALFGKASDWLKAEMHRLDWQAEHEADAVAALATGSADTAVTLSVVAGAAHYYKTGIVEPLEKILTGAMRVPLAPLRHFLDRLSEIRDNANLRAWAETEFLSPIDTEASHPPLAQRLRAIGVPRVPEIPALGPPSVEEVLPAQTVAAVVADAETAWERQIAAYLNLD